MREFLYKFYDDIFYKGLPYFQYIGCIAILDRVYIMVPTLKKKGPVACHRYAVPTGAVGNWATLCKRDGGEWERDEGRRREGREKEEGRERGREKEKRRKEKEDGGKTE